MQYKDEGGGGDQHALTEGFKTLNVAFEEFKSTNDARLKEIEKKGGADVLFGEKLSRLEQSMIGLENLNQRITLAEKQAEAIKGLDDRFSLIETALKRKGAGSVDADTKAVQRAEDFVRAVVAAQTLGYASLEDAQKKTLEDIKTEYKALSVTPDTAGGYLAPIEYVREIIKAVTEISPVRSLARVRQTSNKATQIPKRTGQFAARWVQEQGTKTETTGLTYGLEEIHTHELYALVDISNQMLEDSAFNMQSEISEESAEQFALAEGTAFVSGTGVGQPEGFLQHASLTTTASGTATTIADADGQANGLITMKHSIKSAYARNATWLLNRTTLGSVRKLKDGDKNYIWMPGIALGKPNTIDGDPYVEMPDMPNEGAGNKPIAYGDFRRAYTWVDRITMEMLRDPYTQATSGNVRYIMRKRVGGQVTLVEAITALRCAAS